MKVKFCSKCKKKKFISEFGKNKQTTTGLSCWCKLCKCEDSKIFRKNNPELMKKQSRRLKLKFRYGLTPDEYDQMFKEQNGLCAICGKKETQCNQYGIQRLSVDHNHQNGKVRQLLCNRCNLLVGPMENNLELVDVVLDYLKEHNEQ